MDGELAAGGPGANDQIRNGLRAGWTKSGGFRLSRRAALALVLAWLPLAALAQPEGEAVLRVVSPWELTSNEPDDTGFLLARLGVAETLVQVEPDGRLVAGVAESWRVDADKLTWRFRLRPESRFHDGSPVTAEAVAASLKHAFIGESLSAVPLDSISVEGGQVLIRTKTPFSVLPSFLCDYAGIVLAPSAYGADGKVRAIAATGPYRLAATDGKSVQELERFEAYAGPKPAIARVRHSGVPNGETRANIAIAGDADLVFTLGPTAIPRIDATGRMKVASLTIPRIRPIAFNSGLPQFSDVRVRRAVSLAIDRAGIAAAILRHPGSAATQLLPPVLSDWHDRTLPPLIYDPAAAARLLDEAGWAPGADGIRAKDGVRLAVKLHTIANRPELPVMATAIQAQLCRIGMEIAIEAGPPGSIPAAIRERTMQMTMFARTYVNVPEVIATIIPDYTLERSLWGTVEWPGRSRMKALTDAYVASFDPARQADLRREILRLIHDEAPVIPVSWVEHTVAVSGRIRDVAIDPYELRYLLDRIAWK
jgi:peptide/nickel transport system substrate-binding protein